jgi:hypothetical protein
VTERRARGGRVVGLAEGVAAAVRRRQREREPRTVVYDAVGSPRLVAPSAAGYDELLEAAERMVSEAGGRLVARARPERGEPDEVDPLTEAPP